MNYIHPNNRVPNPRIMKKYLVETRSEEWLLSKMNQGKLNYSNIVKERQVAWSKKNQFHQKTFEECRAGSDAFRMKNSNDCERAVQELGKSNYALYSPVILDGGIEMPSFFHKYEQEEMVEKEILQDCLSAKTIRQAKKIGCYWK